VRILIVDDDDDGRRGLAAALNGGYDLMVRDVMLPGLDGFEILQRVRREARLPILMLTARGEDEDRTTPRLRFEGSSMVNTGLFRARISLLSANVRLAGAAWATNMLSARAATKRFRSSARAAVIRLCLAGNGERIRRRPAANAGASSGLRCIPSMLRAGTQITG
jgi:CheY-like chemotaxis protein